MGIPKFVGGWLGPRSRRDPRFRGVFVNRLTGTHDSLAIDMNGVIHNALAIAMGCGPYYNEEYVKVFNALEPHVKTQRIFDAITMLLVNIVDQVGPRKYLIVAVDGPTGRAKIEQQRGRRYKSALTRTPGYYDTSIVTPGTPFMIDLDEYLRRWFVSNRSFLPPHVFYSSHLVPGEGEHKIMEMYRRGDITQGDGEHVLYGLDADLIMLSMLSPLNNIKLVREDFRKVINIERLKEAVKSAAPPNAKETAVPDFVILSYLLGNDFLPHGPTHNSMDRLFEGFLDAYVKTNKPLATKATAGYFRIDYNVLSEILENFGETEAEILGSEASSYVLPQGTSLPLRETGVSNRFFDVAVVEEPLPEGGSRQVFNYGIFRSAWYTNELGVNRQIAPMAPAPTEDDIAHMCYQYIYGMAWVLRYYQMTEVSTQWYYPYYHAPLYLDIIDVLKYVTAEHAHLGKSLDSNYAKNSRLEYGAMEQLFAVIPPASWDSSIPSFLHMALRGPETPLAPYFPRGIVIEMDGIEPDDHYLAVPIVPRFNMTEIVKTIESLNLPLEVSIRWLSVQTVQIPANDTDVKNYASRLILNQELMASREAERLEKYKREQEYRGGRGYRGGERGRGRGHREHEAPEEFKVHRGRGDRGGRGGTPRGRGEGRGRGDGTPRGRGNRGGRGDGTHRGRGKDTRTKIEKLREKIKEEAYQSPDQPINAIKPLTQPPKKYYNTQPAGPIGPTKPKAEGGIITGIAGGEVTRNFEHLVKSIGTQYDRTSRYYGKETRGGKGTTQEERETPRKETPKTKEAPKPAKEDLVQLM